MSWQKIALAAAGGGGGGGGVTLDLTQLITSSASFVTDHLTESITVERPEATSVFPSVWTQSTFDEILNADNVRVWWGDNLEWHMAEDSWMPGDQMDYTLKCNFQCVHLADDDAEPDMCTPSGGIYLLHNVQPFVDVDDTGWGWRLHVACSLGQAYPAGGGVIAIPVVFDVSVAEGDGDAWRTVRRQFAIHGNGQKETL